MNKEKTVIDLNVLNEGMFSHFLAILGGWIAGKHSQKAVIRGKEEEIAILRDYLKSVKRNQRRLTLMKQPLIWN